MIAILSAFVLTAATVVPVGQFRSIELNDGGRVFVRYGAVQRVAFLKGSAQHTRVRVDDGQLIIEDSGTKTPRGYELELEVVTPQLSSVAVMNGGLVRTVGSFPDQSSIDAAVEQGGAIDIRSIAADTVNASVYQGGMIFATAEETLAARVEQGGAIRYWGDADNIKKSVRNGGVVTRGTSRDTINLGPAPIAPVAPVAPIPPAPPTPPTPPR